MGSPDVGVLRACAGPWLERTRRKERGAVAVGAQHRRQALAQVAPGVPAHGCRSLHTGHWLKRCGRPVSGGQSAGETAIRIRSSGAHSSHVVDESGSMPHTSGSTALFVFGTTVYISCTSAPARTRARTNGITSSSPCLASAVECRTESITTITMLCRGAPLRCVGASGLGETLAAASAAHSFEMAS